MKKTPANIIISRTDSIGDVVLTLPVATVLKQQFPEMTLAFMGKKYTRPVIEACSSVDVFIDEDDFLNGAVLINEKKPEAIIHVLPKAAIAFKALFYGIGKRTGTTNRLFHWLTCNDLVKLSRKNSSLHEAQLNLKLLKNYGLQQNFSLEKIGQMFALTKLKPLERRFQALLDPVKYNLILHPKSQGNGREWGIDNFISLINLLSAADFKIFISGVKAEQPFLQPLLAAAGEKVIDISGQMDLTAFMSFIAASDGLVASGTGPVHLAAALGIDAYAIFPPINPVHPGRWAPLGAKAKTFVVDRDCSDCKANRNACHCIKEVSPTWLELALAEACEKKRADTQPK